MRTTRALVAGILYSAAACSGGDSEGPPTVVSVSISPAAASVEVGQTQQLSASPRDADGNALTNPVTWSSASTTIASVSGSGLVTGVSVGTTTITAASGGQQATATIQVDPPSVATVAVSLAAPSVEQGRTTQASAVLRDAANNVLSGRTTTWTSSNAQVASVSNQGLVTAAQLGSATITATSEGKSGSATVTVIPRGVNTVAVTLTPGSLVVGGSGQAAFVARDIDGQTLTGRTAAWSSSNQQIATVNATSGAVTAVAPGQATITATVEGKSGSAQLTVTAAPVGPSGTVTGRVTAADGVTPIADAQVEVQGTFMVSPRTVANEVARQRAHNRAAFRDRANARVVDGDRSQAAVASPIVSTRTALDGTYTLTNVPTGLQTIVATRGAFRATVNVTVQVNQSVAAPNAALASTGRLAYVGGIFDHIEQIVQTSLGHPIEEIQASSLASAAITSQYRVIFLNCGLNETEATNAAVVANLRTFLQNGGTIYASDFAGVYVAALFPEFSFQYAGEKQNATATVVNAALQTFIGKSSIEVVYNLSDWAEILSIPTTATTLFRGSYFAKPQGGVRVERTNQPLAFVIQHGAGKLVFTTFHNETVATADQIAALRYFIYLP